jgi:hypothetical protein
MVRPNFFIVGAPKCGTTALYEYLKAHPQVFMPDVKEPHHFSTDFSSPRLDLYKNRDDYLALFAGGAGKARVGEGSIWYLYSQRAAQAIKEFEPAARIIIMLRSPIDVMYSLYYQFLYTGNEDLPTFEQALAAEADRKQGRRIPSTLAVAMCEALYYRDVVRYAEQVERYFDVFGRDAVQVIIYDDFKANTAAVYRATLEHLEIDPDFSVEFGMVNVSKRVRNLTLHRGYTYLAKWGMSHLPRPVWYLFRGMVIRPLRTLNTQRAPRPPVGPALRTRLQAELLPEIERLGALLERDLTHWCTPA